MKITRRFLEVIPKSELHVHLDGSIRLSTLIDLAKAMNVRLPSYTEDGLRQLVFKKQYNDLTEYLSGFQYTVAVLQTREALEQVSYELAEDCASEGICYLEVRFAPQLHISSQLRIEEVLLAVDKGLNRFQNHYNNQEAIKAGEMPPFYYGIICCAMRKFSPQFSEYYRKFYEVHQFSHEDLLRDLASRELAMSAVRIRDQYEIPIVGFDLAGEEKGYPAEDHIEAFQIAHRHFMKKTVHAGEAFGPESIFQAITDLHADRIGHGTHLFSKHLLTNTKNIDPDKYITALAQYIADRRITLEVCLTSNRQTIPDFSDGKDHPLDKFLAADLSISICTDNRTVSNTTLTDELALACETSASFTPKRLKNIVIYGFKRGFFPSSYSAKRKYVRQVIEYYEKLEKAEEMRQKTESYSE